MLKSFVKLTAAANICVNDGTLFCRDVVISPDAQRCIQALKERNAVENDDFDNEIGREISLELSLGRLTTFGYYYSTDDFVRKNRYKYPTSNFFVREIGKFGDDSEADFYASFKLIITFMEVIQSIARHSYTDVDINYSLIGVDNKTILLPFTYGTAQITGLSHNNLSDMNSIIAVLRGENSEKRLLYINELIDYLLSITEPMRFGTLISTISAFREACENAYQFYLRDFSYNKLKIELDAKALDFTQKIQSVINDSQSKLVTIPTAFVLVFATFDYSTLNSVRNYASMGSLFIFAVLIQIFLNNQSSSLKFTDASIKAYSQTFSQINTNEFNEKFTLVINELTKQKSRLRIITWLLWSVPLGLLLIWVLLSLQSNNP